MPGQVPKLFPALPLEKVALAGSTYAHNLMTQIIGVRFRVSEYIYFDTLCETS